jgi:hypothetical protein
MLSAYSSTTFVAFEDFYSFLNGVTPVIEQIVMRNEAKSLFSDLDLMSMSMSLAPEPERRMLKIPDEIMRKVRENQPSIGCVIDPHNVLIGHRFVIEEKKLIFTVVTHFRHGQAYNYYYTPSHVSTLYAGNEKQRYLIFAGTKDGLVQVFDQRESDLFHKSNPSNLITETQKYFEEPAGMVFRFYSFSTDSFVEAAHMSSIQRISDTIRQHEVVTLDELGTIILWHIADAKASTFSNAESASGQGRFGIYLEKITKIDTSQSFPGQGLISAFDFCLDLQCKLSLVATSHGVVRCNIFGSKTQLRGPPVYGQKNDDSFAMSVAVLNEDFFVAGFNDGTIRLFSHQFPDPLAFFNFFTTRPIIAISSDPQKLSGKFLATDQEGNHYFFDVGDGSMVASYERFLFC